MIKRVLKLEHGDGCTHVDTLRTRGLVHLEEVNVSVYERFLNTIVRKVGTESPEVSQ